LKLQAAAVLQGIVRRDQASSIFAKKKEEARLKKNKEIKAMRAGELSHKR